MVLSEALAEVIDITKRPEKVVQTLSQINRAIAFFTLKAEFRDDFLEETLDLDNTLYGQVVDLSDLVRFRKVKYIRPTSYRYYLTFGEPEQFFIPGGELQRDKYFVAGNNLTVTLSQLGSSLEIGYFTYAPTITLADEEVEDAVPHWMLLKMPYAVIEKAAAKILFSVGDDASAKMYEASSMEFFLTAKNDFEYQVSHSAS